MPLDAVLESLATHLKTELSRVAGESTLRPGRGGPSEPEDLLPEDFALGQPIASGGMGCVYNARQTSLDRSVAVKKLHRHLLHDRKHCDDLIAEARVSGALEHPNIVPVYALGEGADGPYMAMKKVEGRSWLDFLRERPYCMGKGSLDGAALDEHLSILLSVSQAIAFAHSRGIAHGDLKPANVMLGAFGEVLLMDWGLAVEFKPPADRPWRRPPSSHGPGSGTPAYMAPEQANGDPVGPWTDIYLLGAILFEILTGAPPHKRGNALESLVAASQGILPELPKALPEDLVTIAERALQADPRQRFASATEFQGALKDFTRHRASAAIAERGWRALQAPSPDYAALSRAQAAFEAALEVWPDNRRALSGLDQSHQAYAEIAVTKGDLGLTAEHISHIAASEARLRLERLLREARRSHRQRTRQRRRLKIFNGFLAAGLAAAILLGFLGVSTERDKAVGLSDSLRTALAATREHSEAVLRTTRVAQTALLAEFGKIPIKESTFEQTYGVLEFCESEWRRLESLGPVSQEITLLRLSAAARKGAAVLFSDPSLAESVFVAVLDEINTLSQPLRNEDLALKVETEHQCLTGIAHAFDLRGQPDESRRHHEQALQGLRRLPKGHENRALERVSLNSCADASLQLGDAALAIEFARAALDLDSLGIDGVASRLIVAEALRATGRWEPAMLEVSRVVDVLLRHSGVAAACLRADAALMRLRMSSDGASLAMVEQVFGHMSTLVDGSAESFLAIQRRGELAAALAFEVCRQEPDRASALADLALSDLDARRQSYTQPARPADLHLIGLAYAARGIAAQHGIPEKIEDLTHATQAFEAAARALPFPLDQRESWEHALRSYVILGQTLEKHKDAPQALRAYEAALDISDAQHLASEAAASNLAVAGYSAGLLRVAQNSETAAIRLQQAIDWSQKSNDPKAPKIAAVAGQRLGRWLARQGDTAGADSAYAALVARAGPQPADPQIAYVAAEALFRRAGFARGRDPLSASAEAWLLEVLSRLERQPSSDDARGLAAAANESLGEILVARGAHRDARPRLEAALAAFEAIGDASAAERVRTRLRDWPSDE